MNDRAKPTYMVLTRGMASDCRGVFPKAENIAFRIKGDKSFATISLSDDKNHFIQVVLTESIKERLRECL